MKMGTGKEKIGDPQRESPRARVLRWLEDAIKSGRLPRGAELPTEREIAKIVGVATCTAAMAMDEAEARGLVIRRRPGARRRYAWSPEVLAWIRRNGFHWTAWNFHPKCGPSAVLDWSFAPTPCWGAFVKKALTGQGDGPVE